IAAHDDDRVLEDQAGAQDQGIIVKRNLLKAKSLGWSGRGEFNARTPAPKAFCRNKTNAHGLLPSGWARGALPRFVCAGVGVVLDVVSVALVSFCIRVYSASHQAGCVTSRVTISDAFPPLPYALFARWDPKRPLAAVGAEERGACDRG